MAVLLRRVNELRRSYFLAKRNDNSFITYYRICNQNQNQQARRVPAHFSLFPES